MNFSILDKFKEIDLSKFDLTKIGIFIEGGTEAIFGNEVKLFNAFIGKQATLAEKKLANEVFEKAIGEYHISHK